MARQHDLCVPLVARPSENIEPLRLPGQVLLLDIVALRLQAVGKPVAGGLFVPRDGLNFRELFVEREKVVRQV